MASPLTWWFGWWKFSFQIHRCPSSLHLLHKRTFSPARVGDIALMTRSRCDMRPVKGGVYGSMAVTAQQLYNL